MAFRVDATPEAEQEANVILEWLHLQQAGEAGLRWFRGLNEAIRSAMSIFVIRGHTILYFQIHKMVR